MLVSLKWLNDYVDISDIPPATLAEKLTMAGLEVEGIIEKNANFSGVVVARIEEITPHPNADKLSCCKVFDGSTILDIVCGARNIKIGDVVPLAKVGASLPDGYNIKRSVIRGCPSEGMLCSEVELSIGADNSGIMILPEDLPLGEDLSKALALDDAVLDVGITPNRADCYSMLGIAREVAALFGKAVCYPCCDLKEGGEDTSAFATVQITVPELCPRYSARIIGDVTIAPAPFWMCQRLEAVGIRAINNVVDVTNFVMMEMGQPLHAFDYNFLEGGKIIVRTSEENEKFTSLDGKERELKTKVLMICDAVKPVAIAGIMGGYNSEVREDSRTILLESAYFSPSSIRRSARALGMGTDASLRFEKGIDPNGVLKALERAAYLIASVADGVLFKGCIDEYPQQIETPKAINLRMNKITSLIGVDIERARVKEILTALDMFFVETEMGFLVDPPSYRVDITREADLIEEIIRIYGYEKVPMTFPAFSAQSTTPSALERVEKTARTVFIGYGFSQIITYGFVSPEMAETLRLDKHDRRRHLLAIRNPLVEEHGVMRSSLLYGMLMAMKRNINNNNIDLRFFEIGRVFFANKAGELPIEENHLCAMISGMAFKGNWHFAKSPAGYYDLKGAMTGFLEEIRLQDVVWSSEGGVEPFLHPYRAANIFLGGDKIGFLGELHPEVVASLALDTTPTVMECNLDVLATLSIKSPLFKEFSRFPASYRDVAFLIDESVSLAFLEECVRKANECLLEKTNVFDVFRGGDLPLGKKSVAIRFTYRSDKKTLTEMEINAAHQNVIAAITNTVGAQIRGKAN